VTGTYWGIVGQYWELSWAQSNVRPVSFVQRKQLSHVLVATNWGIFLQEWTAPAWVHPHRPQVLPENLLLCRFSPWAAVPARSLLHNGLPWAAGLTILREKRQPCTASLLD